MNYHILDEHGDKIASFVHECDRNYSLDALLEKFPDCDLKAEDDE